jgi:site-specific DNA-methyltransferase (adenine-specific)
VGNFELNKTYEGDCLQIMANMPDDFVTISITSPPYNIKRKSASILDTKRKNHYADTMTKTDYFEWIKQVISELIRVTKYHVFFNIQENKYNSGIIKYIQSNFDIKETWIWAKKNPPSHIVDTQCANGYEYIFCFSKDRMDTKHFTYCNFSNRNGDYMKNVFIEPVGKGYEGHNFVFPEWLPNFFIKNFSKQNDIVLDCFMGAGTTAIASAKQNRNYIGIELNNEYLQLSEKRLLNETAQSKLF